MWQQLKDYKIKLLKRFERTKKPRKKTLRTLKNHALIFNNYFIYIFFKYKQKTHRRSCLLKLNEIINIHKKYAYATCIKYTSTYEKRGSKGFKRCVVTQKMFNIVLMNFSSHNKFSNMILLADSILYLDIDICFVIIYEEFPKRKTNLNKQLIPSVAWRSYNSCWHWCLQMK